MNYKSIIRELKRNTVFEEQEFNDWVAVKEGPIRFALSRPTLRRQLNTAARVIAKTTTSRVLQNMLYSNTQTRNHHTTRTFLMHGGEYNYVGETPRVITLPEYDDPVYQFLKNKEKAISSESINPPPDFDMHDCVMRTVPYTEALRRFANRTMTQQEYVSLTKKDPSLTLWIGKKIEKELHENPQSYWAKRGWKFEYAE